MTNHTDIEAAEPIDAVAPWRPWSRHDAFALGVLLTSLVAGLVWLVHPWYDPMNDASLYISSTRSLLAGEGYSYLGAPFQLRPPGFSFLLAPVLATVGLDFHLLNLFVAGFGCGVLILLFCWVRPRRGWLLGLIICYAVGLNPVFLRLCSQVMSDVPGVFFILLALLMARRCEYKPSLKAEILLGVCIGLSAYVRVLGLVLLPAILLDRVLRQVRRDPLEASWGQFARRRCLPVIAASAIVFAPWGIRNQMSPIVAPSDQLLNYSYATGLFHRDSGDPQSPRIGLDGFRTRFAERGNQITAALATRLQESKPSAGHIGIAVLILGVFFFGLITSPSAAGFFILCSLMVSGSYFAYQDRLLLPVLVLLIPALSDALHGLIGRRLGTRWATGAIALLWIAIILTDFAPRDRWPKIEANHERMAQISAELARELPKDARLATGRGFHYSMWMNRPVFSLDWADRLLPGAAGIDAVIDRHQINTVLLDPKVSLDRSLEPGLIERYGAGDWIAGVRIIRVRP